MVIKSVVEPEVNQAVQTGYLGNTSDKASVKEGYLDNQKEFFHESNFTRELAYQGVIEAWNFKKIFTDKKVMDFPSPLEGQSCRYLIPTISSHVFFLAYEISESVCPSKKP